MADNQIVDNGALTDYTAATDKVTYSGDANVDVQLVRPVLVTGAEGAKTVVDLPGDGTNGLDVDVTRLPTSSSASLSNQTDQASNATLIASNSSRKGFSIFNDSSQALYVKFGATASSTSFTVKIDAGGYYEQYGPHVYTGIVDGIWAADASGSARSTEW